MVDSQPKKVTIEEYMNLENRFKMLSKTHPEAAKLYYEQATIRAKERFEQLQYMAAKKTNGKTTTVKEELPIKT